MSNLTKTKPKGLLRWRAPEINLTDHNGQQFTMSGQPGRSRQQCSGGNGQHGPKRDTPQALKNFMTHFGPSFLGLTGTPTELQKTWNAYGVSVEDGGETHSTLLYAVDPTGNVRETFLPDAEPSDIARDLSLLLKGK